MKVRRFMPGRCVFIPLLLAVMPAATNLTPADDGIPALTDVVISEGDESIRIRLWVTVDGEPIAVRFIRSQATYVERLFAQLDRNGDGRLDPEEASHAPSPLIELPESVLAGETENVNVAFNFRAVDGNGDGAASRDELLEFYRYFGDGPIRVRHPRPIGANDQPLHNAVASRIDENGDGRLSFDELSGAAKLAALDRDGNDVLDASEFMDTVFTDVNVARTSGESRGYRIRTSPLNDSAADMNVFINYSGDDRVGAPDVRFELAAGRLNAQDAVAGTFLWTLRGLSVEFHADCGPLRVLDRTRRVLALEFRGADADGDGLVRSTERLPAFLAQLFPLLDGDGDTAVSTSELNSFDKGLLPLEALTLGSQVSLSFLSPRDGLFAVLDTNHDGRLGQRELHAAAWRGELLDTDGNGSLEATELRTPIRIVIQRGSLTAPYATDRTADSGPVWFVRMDRNRDGELSPNEFLASPDRFDSLDLNGDGLIGLSEALRAESIERGIPESIE